MPTIPAAEGEMAKGDRKKVPYVSLRGEVARELGVEGRFGVTDELTAIGKLVVDGPSTPRGRPPAYKTSDEIFRRRRKLGINLAATKLAEAADIIAEWPEGLVVPHAKTVRKHIAKAFDAAKKDPPRSR